MTTSRIFLDANVPLYAVGAPSPYREPCRRLLLAAAQGNQQFVTDVEVLQELLHVLRRDRDWKRRAPAFYDFSATMGDSALPVERDDVIRAADLADGEGRSASTRDLIHVAVMRRHGLSRIASADRGFDVFDGVTRLDPAALDEWADPAWFPAD